MPEDEAGTEDAVSGEFPGTDSAVPVDERADLYQYWDPAKYDEWGDDSDERPQSGAWKGVGPTQRPAKLSVAVALLVISGCVVPLIGGIALAFVASAYRGGVSIHEGATAARLIVSSLLVAGFGIYLAARVHHGYAAARWAAIGFLLLVASMGIAGLADGRVDPVSFSVVVALVGISPLVDPGVRAWCRHGDRPVEVGIAQLAALVGVEMTLTGLIDVWSRAGGPLAVFHAAAGIATVCLALGLYKDMPGSWVLVAALMLIQPIFYAGLDGVSGRAELLTALGRLALSGYVVLTLVYVTRARLPATRC